MGRYSFAFVTKNMEYIPFSSFQRPITHVQLQAAERREAAGATHPVNKWALFRELSKAQSAFGLSERELTVLQGLISFYPDDMLGGEAQMIVYPSNKALCERLNGMACSTMRRHLARLIEAGFVQRRDSPNGKRYSRSLGEARVAYGFDLSPLPRRAAEITAAAEEIRAAEEHLRRLRECVSLMRRDLAAVASYGAELTPGQDAWDYFADKAALSARALRRKLTEADLNALRIDLEAALDQARTLIDGTETEDLSTTARQSEQHHQNSDKDSLVFEQVEQACGTVVEDRPEEALTEEEAGEEVERPMPRIPLRLILSACPSIHDFHEGPIRHWHQLFNAASQVRPAMGINSSAWDEACRLMGPEQAAVVVVAMLERFTEIRSPGGYLRALSAKAAEGAFSCGPMIMALMNGGRKAA